MKENILVVEDDDLVRSGLVAALAGDEYTVYAAATGEEALHLLARVPVGLILSDLVMEPMDGMALLKQVRETYPELAFIMITGHGTVGRALDAMRQGASDFIQKPASSEAIRQRVREVLDSVRLRNNLLLERRHIQEQKDEVQRRLVRDQRMISLGRLADGISDYLADVLNPIFRSSSLILQSLPKEHPLHADAEAIEETVRKTMSLIRDLETIGHGAELRVEAVRLEEVIEELLRSENDMAELQRLSPGVKLDYRASPPLPPISGSPTQLYALLKNMVFHAAEGMPKGGHIHLHLRTEQTNGDGTEPSEQEGHRRTFVVLHIADDAGDPPAQDMERLFEPFQPRTIAGELTSTGLALSVVYRVVQEHHGFIDVRLRPKGGTEYVLSFPPHRPALPEKDVQTPQDYTGHERVLIVDDYPVHQELAASLLRSLGYRVSIAQNGREAVSMVRSADPRNPFDLIVLDLVLGDAFDGVETYKEMVALKPGQRAILVSGFAEFNRIVEARKIGLHRYVQKPYELESLGRAVRAELDRH